MKKLLSIFLSLLLLGDTTACGNAQGIEQESGAVNNLSAAPISTVSFTDIADGMWYAEAVRYCLEHGLMDGTSSTTFSPVEPATRAVLVTALHRQAGSPAVQQGASFTDVPAGASYADAVSWAAANSIAGGYGDGRFGGEAPVTREQFAAMIWRVEGQPDSNGSETFADHNEISAYAVNAVAWAKSAGIINGKANNLFDPKANITRGEVAVMLYRWLNPGLPYDGVYPQHEPYGTGIGAMPGRVVWAYDPDSVDWDGEGYWWRLDNFDETVIQSMVDASIASLGGKENVKEGWAALFQAHNGGSGYTAGEKIAIKANINGSGVMDDDTSGETRMSYTNPVLLKVLLTSLVEDAGVAPSDISTQMTLVRGHRPLKTPTQQEIKNAVFIRQAWRLIKETP